MGPLTKCLRRAYVPRARVYAWCHEALQSKDRTLGINDDSHAHYNGTHEHYPSSSSVDGKRRGTYRRRLLSTAAAAIITSSNTAVAIAAATPSRRFALLRFLRPDLDCRLFQRLVENIVA